MLTIKSFFIVCILWALCYITCGLPIYETNDDTVMSMLCGGAGFSSRPDEHILYTHYWVGLLLKHLYSLKSDFCWYGAYLLLAQIVSATVITSIFLHKCRTKASLALILALLFMSVFLRPCLLFQFTTTAALTAAAGCMLWLEGLERQKRERTTCTVGGFFFVIVGSLIRHESALLVMVLTAIYLLARALFSGEWKIFLRGILTTILGVIAVLLVWGQNEFYYAHSEGWSDFYHHNRCAFNLLVGERLSPVRVEVRKAMKNAGWLPVDMEMFKTWGYLDDKLFSTDKLSSIDESIGTVNVSSAPLVLGILRDRLLDKSLIAVHLTLIFCLLLCCRRWSLLRSACLYLLVMLGLMIAIMSTKYLPVHVYAAMVLTTALFGLYSLPCQALDNLLENRKALAFAMTTIFALTAISISSFQEHAAALAIRRTSLFKSLKELKAHKKRALICWTSLFPYELIRPFDTLPTYLRGLRLIGINYMVRTPINRKSIHDLGIGDLFAELDAPGLCLIANKCILPLIKAYVEQHYHKTPEFRAILEDQLTPLDVYKIDFQPLVKQSKPVSSWAELDRVTICDQPPADLVALPLKDGKWECLRAIRVSERSGATTYQNTGIWPTLVYTGPLALKLSDYAQLYLEVAPSDWMLYGREAHVQLLVNGKTSVSFSIPYQAGNRLRGYSFDLGSLDLKPADQICNLNLVLFDGIAQNGLEKTGDTIAIGRIGLVRKRLGRIPLLFGGF